MDENTYSVEQPSRGIQIYFVKAKTAKEAKLKVDRNDFDIEPIEGIFNRHFKASKATLLEKK